MPHRFVHRWLTFDDRRASSRRLAWRFIAAVVALLALAGMLALLSAR